MNMPSLDQVTLVTEQDEVIGSMDKIKAHRGKGKLHRASSVFLFRKNDDGELELLVQERSKKKIVGAGKWANTVCGNVWPEETYEECARRRLSFELGIDASDMELNDIATFRYQAQCNDEFSENEIVHIFAGWYDGDVQLNPDEVAGVEWVKWEETSGREGRWTPWFKLFMHDPSIRTAQESYVSA